tara:strand:- start:839 stop:1687 length:849 start_codon:yes stop_codon:yes gene_type:complete
MKKVLTIFLILMVYFIFINVNNGGQISKELNQNNNIYSSNSFIAHAGGGYLENTYTNSKEALSGSVRNGYKLIELDLLVTKDKKIVASHDWGALEGMCKKKFTDRENIFFKDVVTCKKLYLKNNSQVSLLTAEDINTIFMRNNNLILFTDKISDYLLLKKEFDFLDRIIVETHSKKNYIIAKILGIKNPMFTFDDGRRNIYFSYFFNVKLIAISTHNVQRMKYKKFLKNYYKKKGAIYAWTSNNLEFNTKYIGKLITGVYTDFWNLDNGNCSSMIKQQCHFY